MGGSSGIQGQAPDLLRALSINRQKLLQIPLDSMFLIYGSMRISNIDFSTHKCRVVMVTQRAGVYIVHIGEYNLLGNIQFSILRTS